MPLQGTITITDYGWYEYLSRKAYWDEVNFWTPSARHAFHAGEFSPFLFKLKAPHNAIAGFGYFARYTALPAWLAWECFGQGNGCQSLGELKKRVDVIRRRISYTDPEPNPHIGCIVIVSAVFFPREAWIPQPSDWPVRTQRPTKYDLDHGEGQRVWLECLARAGSQDQATAGSSDRVASPGSVYGRPTLVRPRLGQGAFRVAVTDAYGRACAATGEHSLPALEAAHIKPLAQAGPHQVQNGLLLRADLHRLFDQGYLTVTPDHKVHVSYRLRADYDNGRAYYPMDGRPISLPDDPREQPDPHLLSWHNEHVFLG